MMKPKGLGRGLDALLGGGKADSAASAAAADVLRDLAIADLKPGKYQPRTRMDQDALQELAQSIKHRGIVQPILARAIAGGKFEIVAGERRWRAAQIAGLQRVPVLVREIADDAALGIGLIENIQREDLNAMEEAAGIQRLITEFNLTHEEAAEAVGRSRTAVTNLLRLLELAKPVQDMVMEAKLDMGHARALLSLAKAKQVELAHQIVHKNFSVREAERLVKAESAPPKATKTTISADADTRRLENDLAEKLGTRVTLKADAKGKGTLSIEFLDYEHLDGILERTKLK
jgi:ParB family transcriptional regulator, chromosome partitioning protein